MEFIKITEKNQHQIEIVYSILKASGSYMVNNFGLMHWAKPYSKEQIEKDIENKDVYIVFGNLFRAILHKLLQNKFVTQIWIRCAHEIYSQPNL